MYVLHNVGLIRIREKEDRKNVRRSRFVFMHTSLLSIMDGVQISRLYAL